MKDISKILVVEDSDEVVEAISVAIQIRWPFLEILSTGKGEEAVELVSRQSPDIVILDLGLIDISGYEVLKKIRLFSNVPVLILTVRDEESDIIKGLELGADEYVIKPFRQLELLSRIRAITRRVYATDKQAPIVYGKFYFDPMTKVVSYKGKQSVLTHTESNILFTLMQNVNTVVTHSKIAESIWGSTYPETGASIKVYISRLRKKIETNPAAPRFIITKPNLGYLFIAPTG